MTTEPNPYSPPQSHVADVDVADLPSRWLRLGGAILDTIAVMLVTVPVMWVAGYWADAFAGKQPDLVTQLGWGLFGIVVFFAVHGWFLYQDGQTLAKRLLGMKIVDAKAGGKPPFLRLAGMRYMLPQLIYIAPIAGPIIALVGILLIFRADRRPLHDHLAGTRVVFVR